MKNYETLAHNTSAPVGPVRERLHGGLLALLYFKLREFQKLTVELDQLKRAIFYGKPEAGGNMTMPHSADDNARHAFRGDQPIELMHAGLGLATEAGELLQAVGDHIFEGIDLDPVNIGEEIGDSLWYLAKAAKFTGTTIELEQVKNIAKLAARYPDKFTDAAALERDLAAERKALESPAS